MRNLILPSLLMLVLLQSCQKDTSTQNSSSKPAYLKLQFRNVVKGDPLRLGTSYQNSFEEDFSISTLKYYISNIALYTGQEEAPALPETYFLIDESNDASKTITIPISAGSYGNLDLLLGVDSARNVGGAQTGALNPANGMFWSRNSGYIMMKVEGQSNSSPAPNNRIQYHIGGFDEPYNSLRHMRYVFFTPLTVEEGQTLSVSFTSDLLRWFNGVHELPIKSYPVVTAPDSLSIRYADNAAAMINITRAKVE